MCASTPNRPIEDQEVKQQKYKKANHCRVVDMGKGTPKENLLKTLLLWNEVVWLFIYVYKLITLSSCIRKLFSLGFWGVQKWQLIHSWPFHLFVAGLFLSCLDVEVHYGTACKSVTTTISRFKKKEIGWRVFRPDGVWVKATWTDFIP